MSDTDLEHRLQSLGELSRPSRAALGVDELHRGAERVKRRRQLMVALPGVVVVLALAAGALALREDAPVRIDAAGPPATSLTDRDKELLDFVRATVDLRHELILESFDAVSFAANGGGTFDLAPQRSRTDLARQSFEATLTRVDPGRDSVEVRDSLVQVANRFKQLPVIRASVDGVQNDALGLLAQYQSAIGDLLRNEQGIIFSTNAVLLLRGLLSHQNLGAVTDAEARTAASLMISVKIGFYASTLPGGSVRVPIKDAEPVGCNADAADAREKCKSYTSVLDAMSDVSRAEGTFDEYPTRTGKQGQIKRVADASAERYRGLTKLALEDGQGRNDLTGLAPGSTAIDPAAFRAAAEERIALLITAERQVLDLIQ
jgi:hypothetical protein